MIKKKIAITGGIGSGKSTVLQLLKEMGYPVFSCDELYREVIRSQSYIQKITGVFPNVIENGEINRKKLAAEVFSDEKKRKTLNSIAHPLIMQQLMKEMDAAENEFVFAEVPLLFEGNYEGLFDAVIVVQRKIEDRIRFICLRDGLTEQQAKERIASQFDYQAIEENLKFKQCNAYILLNELKKDALKFPLKRIISDIEKSK